MSELKLTIVSWNNEGEIVFYSLRSTAVED